MACCETSLPFEPQYQKPLQMEIAPTGAGGNKLSGPGGCESGGSKPPLRGAAGQGTGGAACRWVPGRSPGRREGWLDSIGVDLTELKLTRKIKTRSCRFRFAATWNNLVEEKRLLDALGSQYQFNL